MAEDYKKSRVNYNEGGMCHETHQNFKYKKLTEHCKKGGCGECQTSCQSACKTSCTVGNQSCEHK